MPSTTVREPYGAGERVDASDPRSAPSGSIVVVERGERAWSGGDVDGSVVVGLRDGIANVDDEALIDGQPAGIGDDGAERVRARWVPSGGDAVSLGQATDTQAGSACTHGIDPQGLVVDDVRSRAGLLV